MYGYDTQPLNWKGWMAVLVYGSAHDFADLERTRTRGRRRCDLAGADGRRDFDLLPALLGEDGRAVALALGSERIAGLV